MRTVSDQHMTTIKDIARECGVSANTVSCVLNNKPGEVSVRTRDRVMEAVRRLGYRPSAAARRMVGKLAHTIGIADQYTPITYADPYKVSLLEPMIRSARANRWDVLYYSGHYEPGGYPAFLDGRCDGLLCVTGSIAITEIDAIAQTGLPVVFIAQPRGPEGSAPPSFIDVDNEQGGFIAVSHLIGLGHKRIGMMQANDTCGNDARTDGYRRAHVVAGLTVDESLLYQAVSWDQSGYEYAKRLMALPADQRPTALFCFNDVLALATLRAAVEAGVRVPEEFSVIGFDDVAECASSIPPLTTVRQPLSWIGQRAVEMLIGIIEGRIPPDHHEIVAPELIVRSSTAPPRSK